MTERKVSGVIVDELTAAQQTLNALNELMDNESDSIKYEKMIVEKDGVMIEIEIPSMNLIFLMIWTMTNLLKKEKDL